MEAVRLNTERNDYTYADYAEWETNDRYELIDGKAYMMASPKTAHQRMAGNIYRQLGNWLDGKTCEPFISPLDVCLFGKGDEDRTVFQPDVFVVCDPSKVTDGYVNGAPDFIVEVLSPSTASVDLLFKLNMYRKAGVKEYWVVEPETRTVQVFVLNNGKYEVTTYENADTVPVSVFEGCTISFGGH